MCNIVVSFCLFVVYVREYIGYNIGTPFHAYNIHLSVYLVTTYIYHSLASVSQTTPLAARRPPMPNAKSLPPSTVSHNSSD